MKLILFFVSLFSTVFSFSQNYFQQKVAYTIDVQLFDEENILRGFETFTYENNSPDELSFIYIHLWPNAYKNNKTALGEQLMRMGNTELEYANEAEKGYIDSLDFKVNGEKAEWELDTEHIDICKLILKTPLKTGEKITISTPFKVKIPSGDISRMGYVGESFQITQWYPKPAVYDQNGWHEMPYLTQGEFYSEYGTFDVSITLPKNYIVGATGDLQTQSEIEFLEEKAASTDFSKIKKNKDFPKSDIELKTIRFIQKDVHDFAWFADKRFEVLKGEVKLPNSGRTVTSWAYFVPSNADLWKDAIEYLNDAIFYYSEWNGDYPYNHVTAVDGTISAGGGMEYPNITVIGETDSKEELEVVIVHEVGHNWFYGLLGSNERDHAWMDEGLNTLNEIRYMETKYPNNTRMSDMARGVVARVHLQGLGHQDMSDFTFLAVASYGLDQPIELGSDDYTNTNYGAVVYAKTGLVFLYLKDYLGEVEFDKAMQAYYDEWHYKHPQPEDIRKSLEKTTGKDLSWLFEDLIQTTKQIDYKIQSVKMEDGKSTVKIRNVGQINSPIRVDAYYEGEKVATEWLEPSEEKVGSVVFNGIIFDQFILDSDKQMPESNRNNNYWAEKGLFHRTEPFKMELVGGDNEGDKWNNFWMPAIGFNKYDKLMIGAVFHNQTIAKNKLEYTIAPLFSFGRTSVSGFADINYSWIPAKHVRMTTLGVVSKTFGNGLSFYPYIQSRTPTHYTVQPYLNIEIGKPAAKNNYKQRLKIQGNYILEKGEGSNTLYGGTLNYGFSYAKKRHAINSKLRVDYQSVFIENGYSTSLDLLKASLEGEYIFTYLKRKKKHMSIRAFLGQNVFYNGIKDERYGFALGGQTGEQDVTYDHYLLGRNETSGLFSNQRIENHGGFKTNAPISISENGATLFATNLFIELPYIPFTGIYADYGFISDFALLNSYFDVGIGVKLSTILGVYFPLYESNSIRNAYSSGTNYGEKIRFTLDLTGLSLAKLIPRFL